MARDRRAEVFQAKEHVTERWVYRRLGRTDHERRVVAIASTLFDLARPLHRLRSPDRRLLRLAALVHDVGRRVDDETHPEAGERMLARDSYLPLSPAERRAMRYLTRYHRGAVPQIGYDDILLTSDNRKSLRVVLALLRAADALDNRNISPPRLLIIMKDRRIRVTCFLDQDNPRLRRIFRRRKKLRLLEELLDCRVEIRVKHVEAVHTVA
jgi:exopolyphosphatase/guanosine-5'-triphosphate,3'-diphosphate pyrophosphatase